MMKKTIILLKAAVFSLMLLCSLFQGKAQTWDTIPGMVNGVNALDFCKFGDTLIIAGNFSSNMPLTNSNCVIGWTGSTCISYIGNILSTAPGYSVYVYKDQLYLGGMFGSPSNDTDIEKFAVWNGTSWEQVGNAVMSPQGRVTHLLEYRDTLYVGGDYGVINYNPSLSILVKWDGVGFYSCRPYAAMCLSLAVYNDVLYSGIYGAFINNDGSPIEGFAKYNGVSWSLVYDRNGVMFPGCVNSLLTDTINNDLYIGCVQVYRYDGEYFHQIAQMNGQVNRHAMRMYHGDLYIGGMFTQVNEIPANYIAKWDGEQWSEPGDGVKNVIEALYVYKDELYVGGYFDTVGGYLPAYGVARYYEPAVEDCHWFRPRIQTIGYQDTFYITQSQPYVFVNFVNNNAYAESWEWDFGTSTGSVSSTATVGYTYTQPGEYAVLVEVTQDGCTKTAEKLIVIEDHTGGIANRAGNGEITPFPNPGSGQVVIKTNNGKTIGSLCISSTSGKQMYKAEISGPEIIIDISQWNAGTYLVECKEHGVMKLLVE